MLMLEQGVPESDRIVGAGISWWGWQGVETLMRKAKHNGKY